MAGRLETFSFIPLLPLCHLWQGESCCSAPARESLDLLRARQSRHWRSWGSQALLWHLPPQPQTLQPWLCPARTQRLPLCQTKALWLLFQSLASLATCMALPNLTLPFLSPCGKTPPVLEVQVALELLSGCCQLWVPTSSPGCPPPAPAQPRVSAGAPAAPVAATGGLLHKSPEIAMRGLAGRGWADARQTARHQAGCAGLAGGGEELWSSALGSCRRDAPSWSWGRLAGVEKMVGSISSPRTGLCHQGLMGARVWVGAPPSHGERRKVQLLCRF